MKVDHDQNTRYDVSNDAKRRYLLSAEENRVVNEEFRKPWEHVFVKALVITCKVLRLRHGVPTIWVTPAYFLSIWWALYVKKYNNAPTVMYNPYYHIVKHPPTLVMCGFFWSTLTLLLCLILRR